MTVRDDLATTEEVAAILGVTVQHVRRLTDAGHLTRVARGLVDRRSLDRYQAVTRGRRTRAWAEKTAWGAVALLSGQRAPWLGPTQVSRLRRVLMTEMDAVGLATRTRERATVRTYRAHSAAMARLVDHVVMVDQDRLGLVGEVVRSGLHPMGPPEWPNRVDGYCTSTALVTDVGVLGLQEDPSGNVTLRSTGFDIDIVRSLANAKVPVLAALDAGTSLDPREQGVGLRVLDTALAGYRR